jgi:hypothetical protein
MSQDFGSFETCRSTQRVSFYQRRPELGGAWSEQPRRETLLVDSGHDLCPARGNCGLLRSHAPASSHKITELGESQALTIYRRHLIWSDETEPSETRP